MEVQANAPANRFLFTVPLITAAVEVGKTQLSRVMEDRSGAERRDFRYPNKENYVGALHGCMLEVRQTQNRCMLIRFVDKFRMVKTDTLMVGSH